MMRAAPRSRQRGMLLNPFRFGGATSDPYWSQVVSLLHFDGADGSVAFPDEKGLLWSRNGDARISAAEYKYGGASGYFDGAGDSLSIESTQFDMGGGDFTVECWLRPIALAQTYHIVFDSRTTSGGNGILLWVNASGQLRSWCQANQDAVTGTAAVPLDQWTHVAVTKRSGSIRVFAGGVAGVQDASATGPVSSGRAFIAQTQEGGNNYAGYIDDLRVTRGVSRYWSNFVPATDPFPNG